MLKTTNQLQLTRIRWQLFQAISLAIVITVMVSTLSLVSFASAWSGGDWTIALFGGMFLFLVAVPFLLSAPLLMVVVPFMQKSKDDEFAQSRTICGLGYATIIVLNILGGFTFILIALPISLIIHCVVGILTWQEFRSIQTRTSAGTSLDKPELTAEGATQEDVQ